MQLENLHKHVNLNKLANGTIEVLFAGQPALTINQYSGMYSWVINPVFAKLTYGANVFSDVPYCQESFDLVEEAVADGLAKLESVGAFYGIADLPDDSYSIKTDEYKAAQADMDADVRQFALHHGNSLTESIEYLTRLKFKTLKPAFTSEYLIEKFVSKEEFTEQEKTAISEHVYLGTGCINPENGLPINTIFTIFESADQQKLEADAHRLEAKRIRNSANLMADKGMHEISKRYHEIADSHDLAAERKEKECGCTNAPEPVQETNTSADAVKTSFQDFKSRKAALVTEGSTRRLISTHTGTDRHAKVYKDSETGEHVVKFYKDGEHQKEADYFTDGDGAKEDAQSTAKSWVNNRVYEGNDRSEFSANSRLAQTAKSSATNAAKKSYRIVSPSGGTVSKHSSEEEAKKAFDEKKYGKKFVIEASDNEIDWEKLEIVSEAETEDVDKRFDQWKNDVLSKHGSDKGIKFKGRIENGNHSISAEVPGEDRSYGVWDHHNDTGHVFEDCDCPPVIGDEVIEERELTDTEKAKKEKIVTALKARKGFTSKYGKDAIYAVATMMAKTAGE